MKENVKRISIVIIIVIAFLGLKYFTYSLKNERPDELYEKMQGISDSQILIGLSKEEVEELLGEPGYKNNYETISSYAYNAGELDKGIFLRNTCIIFDCTYDCELRISFDEKDMVKSTSIQLIP